MLQNGDIPSSPIPMSSLAQIDNEPIPPWPREVKDMNDQLGSFSVVSRGVRSTVYL
jgi:hypothetical protein